MFQMKRTGQTIANLRKERNMTQMELADQLGISFQAVSNWERGNSMPDIAKLPELAQLFGVTIDQLLGEESPLVTHAAQGDLKEYLEEHPAEPAELIQTAPLLKPRQVDTVFSSIPQEEMPGAEELGFLLPFLSEDMVDQLAEKAARQKNWKCLDACQTFASEPVLDRIAMQLAEQGEPRSQMYPFVSQECLRQMVERMYPVSGLQKLAAAFPFLSDETLVWLAETEYEKNGEKNGLRDITALAPFLPDDALNELARRAIQRGGIRAISPIAAFLDRDMLSEFVREAYL